MWSLALIACRTSTERVWQLYHAPGEDHAARYRIRDWRRPVLRMWGRVPGDPSIEVGIVVQQAFIDGDFGGLV